MLTFTCIYKLGFGAIWGGLDIHHVLNFREQWYDAHTYSTLLQTTTYTQQHIHKLHIKQHRIKQTNNLSSSTYKTTTYTCFPILAMCDIYQTRIISYSNLYINHHNDSETYSRWWTTRDKLGLVLGRANNSAMMISTYINGTDEVKSTGGERETESEWISQREKVVEREKAKRLNRREDKAKRERESERERERDSER